MRQRRDLWVAVTVVVMTAPRPTIPAIPARDHRRWKAAGSGGVGLRNGSIRRCGQVVSEIGWDRHVAIAVAMC